MHRGQSLYLDLLRLAAALEVFVFHLARLRHTGVAPALWNSFGHEAVTIFFVLSGFVIPYAAGSRDADARAFIVARVTRIYSVALPCLALTVLCDWIGHGLDPSLYRGMSPSGSVFAKLGAGAAMINESWGSVQMLSNTPYWSISYEFWYYAVFAALFYLRGWSRIVATIVVSLIAGPNIVLLFPIWAAGWLAVRERFTASWPKWLLWICFAQPLIVFAVYYHSNLQGVGGRWLEQGLGHDIWWNKLAWSRYLLTDALLGFSVALNLAAAKRLGPALERGIGRFERPIRWGVARSFTLYLLHQPVILVVTAMLVTVVPDPFRGPTICTIVLVVIAVVAQVTELQRDHLKPIVQWIVDRVSGISTAVIRMIKPATACC